MTTEAFSPWIQPLDNNGQFLSPWIISDDDVASELVAEWLTVIEYLFTAFAGQLQLQHHSVDTICFVRYSKCCFSCVYNVYSMLMLIEDSFEVTEVGRIKVYGVLAVLII